MKINHQVTAGASSSFRSSDMLNFPNTCTQDTTCACNLWCSCSHIFIKQNWSWLLKDFHIDLRIGNKRGFCFSTTYIKYSDSWLNQLSWLFWHIFLMLGQLWGTLVINLGALLDSFSFNVYLNRPLLFLLTTFSPVHISSSPFLPPSVFFIASLPSISPTFFPL